MKVTRAASIPLVTHDPYFSIWSGADHLYDKDPVHWSQIRQQLRGYVNVDGVVYSFLGDKEFHETIGQADVDVTATSTTYTFENEKIILNVKFTSPLLLDDLTLVSRPCTYIDYTVEKKENCDVRVDFVVSSDLVSQKQAESINGMEKEISLSISVPLHISISKLFVCFILFLPPCAPCNKSRGTLPASPARSARLSQHFRENVQSCYWTAFR